VGCDNAAYIFQSLLILIKFASEKITQSLLGDVILGGTEAARNQNGIADRKSMAKIFFNIFGQITDGEDSGNRHSRLREHLRHLRRIRINNLSYKEFISYIQN
jgi:hypothetical protein